MDLRSQHRGISSGRFPVTLEIPQANVDNSRKVIAEHSIAGEKWRTYQNYVIVDRPVLFERLQRAGKRLVWIMRERRIRTGNAQEKFGEFGADRDKSYIGYFDGDKFTVREIHSEIWSSEPKKKSL